MNCHRVGAAGALLGAWLLASVLGCSTDGASRALAASDSPRTLTDVRVERTGSATVVSLLGVGEPEWKSFEQLNPRQLVVEMSGVRPDRLAERVTLREGGVTEIGVTETGAGTTRVVLGLAPGASGEVVPVGDRLEIRVRQTVQTGSAAASVDSAPSVDAAPPSVSAGPPAVSAGPNAGETDLSSLPEATDVPAQSAPATPSAQPAAASEPTAANAGGTAGALLSVEPQASPEGTVLLLRGDGRIDGAKSFVLTHPDRLVVDLAGVRNATSSARVDVGSPEVSRVRVAQHDGKVRVVVDGGAKSEPFAQNHLVPSAQGLVVAVGASESVAVQAAGAAAGAPIAVAASAPAKKAQPQKAEKTAPPVAAQPAPEPAPTAPAAAAAPAPAPEVVTETASTPAPAAAPAPTLPRVTGLRFEVEGEVERIVVTGDGNVKSGAMLRPDDDTVVIRFLGATLDPQTPTKIVPETPGAVSLITAFEQPPGKRQKQPEVRVVVRRAAGIEPKLTRSGGVATFEFRKSDLVAKKPPMLVAPEAGGVAQTAPLGAGRSGGAAAAAALDGGSSADILQEGGLIGGKEYTGRRISLDLREVEIDDVLRLVAEVSDLNVIAGDDVNGKVTIRLVDVPWDQALDVILLTRGLGFVRVGSVLRIAPQSVLQQEEEARLQERRAKEKLADLAVKLQPVNYANVEEVEKMVKRLLTPRGVVNVDKRTSTVIIKDIPQVIDEATALVKAIDTQTPQVMIEAKIVEAGLDFSREIGAVWGLGSNPTDSLGSGGLVLSETNQSSTFPFQTPNNIVTANPITSLANGLLNVGAFLLDERFNVDLQLQAAESNGEGKVISSPRVVTLDNREAKIEQGVSIPFQTFENGDAQLEFIDAVLSLLVTPHITADKSIIMKIEVTRNAPDDSVPTPTGSPAIAKNQAKTETLVKDGQTLVIGGIYVVQKGDRSSRVPYVHKIPIIGAAFKNREVRDVRKELLIFVTPRVVEGQEAVAQAQ